MAVQIAPICTGLGASELDLAADQNGGYWPGTIGVGYAFWLQEYLAWLTRHDRGGGRS